MKPRATDSERVIDYLTALARDQGVHVVSLDAIIGACDIRPLKWPELFEKHLKDVVEAVPGRDAYRLRKKRSDLMTRLTDEERVVDHLLKVGAASLADIRRALSMAESDTKDILRRLADDGRAQHEGRGRGVRWSLVETRPVPPPVEATPVVEERAAPVVEAPQLAGTWPAGCTTAGPGGGCTAQPCECIEDSEVEPVAAKDLAALRKAVAGHVGMSERASNELLIRGLETMRVNVSADRMALQETQDALAAERRALADAEGCCQLAVGRAEKAETERDAAREEAAGWKARAERAERDASDQRARAEQAEAEHGKEHRKGNRMAADLTVCMNQLAQAEALLEVVYKALGLPKGQATDEAITKAIAGLMASSTASHDGRIPYEVLEQRLAHYRRAWCDLAGAVTGTPTDKAGEHNELEVGAVLAMATKMRADADTAADLPAIIDRLAKERDEARSQRDELERRAEATNDALWELRRKARRNLDRARIKLADAQNRLDAIESVPLALDPIPF